MKIYTVYVTYSDIYMDYDTVRIIKGFINEDEAFLYKNKLKKFYEDKKAETNVLEDQYKELPEWLDKRVDLFTDYIYHLDVKIKEMEVL